MYQHPLINRNKGLDSSIPEPEYRRRISAYVGNKCIKQWYNQSLREVMAYIRNAHPEVSKIVSDCGYVEHI